MKLYYTFRLPKTYVILGFVIKYMFVVQLFFTQNICKVHNKYYTLKTTYFLSMNQLDTYDDF